MIKKKNKFWTFCFSLIPGAAEMYMGFMKMGLTLMSLFFGAIAVTGLLNFPILLLLITIIWFYSFFHARNLVGLRDEEFYALEDDYLFDISSLVKNREEFLKSYRKIIAIVLIFFGTVTIWKSFFQMIDWYLPVNMRMYFSFVSNFTPRLVIGIGIIFIGITLIRGKKKELEKEEIENGFTGERYAEDRDRKETGSED